jgi:hypothetical protein
VTTCKAVYVAEVVVRDGESNSLTLVNLIEEVRPQGFPILVPRLTIVVVLERSVGDPQDTNGRLVVTVGDAELVTVPMNVSFQERPRLRVITNFAGFVIPSPGTLRISVFVPAGAREPLTVHEIQIVPVQQQPETKTVKG